MDEATLTVCQTENPDAGEQQQHKRKSSCLSECYLNKTNVLQNGRIVKAMALDAFSRTVDPKLTSLLNAGIETCLAEQEQFAEKHAHQKGQRGGGAGRRESASAKDGHKHCSRRAAFFIMCVEGSIYKNCPAPQKVDSADCTALADFMAKCVPPKKD